MFQLPCHSKDSDHMPKKHFTALLAVLPLVIAAVDMLLIKGLTVLNAKQGDTANEAVMEAAAVAVVITAPVLCFIPEIIGLFTSIRMHKSLDIDAPYITVRNSIGRISLFAAEILLTLLWLIASVYITIEFFRT